MAKKTLILSGKKTIQYDNCMANDVYEVIRYFFPSSAKDWTAEIVFPFLASGADADHWLKILRNVEYNRNNPKSQRRKSRRSAGKAPKNHNPAEMVTRRTTTDSLFNERKD